MGYFTLPKTNIALATEKWLLGDDPFFFGKVGESIVHFQGRSTVDGSEIRLTPVEVGSLSCNLHGLYYIPGHFLAGRVHKRWMDLGKKNCGKAIHGYYTLKGIPQRDFLPRHILQRWTYTSNWQRKSTWVEHGCYGPTECGTSSWSCYWKFAVAFKNATLRSTWLKHKIEQKIMQQMKSSRVHASEFE